MTWLDRLLGWLEAKTRGVPCVVLSALQLAITPILAALDWWLAGVPG